MLREYVFINELTFELAIRFEKESILLGVFFGALTHYLLKPNT